MSAPATFVEEGSEGARLFVRVTPQARSKGFDGVKDDGMGRLRLCIKITEAPEKGKANKAVVALLAKTLRMPKGAFEVTDGQTARNKTLCIAGTGTEQAAVMAALKALVK